VTGVQTCALPISSAEILAQWFETLFAVLRAPAGTREFYEQTAQALAAVKSLAAARRMLESGYANAIQFLRSRSPKELAQPMPPGPIMGGQPLSDIVWAMVEHTAHHRGALTVYSRLLGKVPPMPYGG
jgi:uncharacterized damage-inducible protein DinB